jgi:hypothetical protein
VSGKKCHQNPCCNVEVVKPVSHFLGTRKYSILHALQLNRNEYNCGSEGLHGCIEEAQEREESESVF